MQGLAAPDGKSLVYGQVDSGDHDINVGKTLPLKLYATPLNLRDSLGPALPLSKNANRELI